MDGVAEEEATELLFLTWVSGSLLVLMKAFEFLLSKAGDDDPPPTPPAPSPKKDVLKSRSDSEGKKKDLMILSNVSGKGRRGFVAIVIWH